MILMIHTVGHDEHGRKIDDEDYVEAPSIEALWSRGDVPTRVRYLLLGHTFAFNTHPEKMPLRRYLCERNNHPDGNVLGSREINTEEIGDNEVKHIYIMNDAGKTIAHHILYKEDEKGNEVKKSNKK